MNSQNLHLLEQYSHLEYLLLGDLRDLLEERPDPENRRWLVAVLDVLLDMLPREFDLAREDGYLEFVRDQHPNWERQVERLEREHGRMYDRLRQLHERIAANEWMGPVASELRKDLGEWMDALMSHHRSERRLLQAAANLDIGAGG